MSDDYLLLFVIAICRWWRGITAKLEWITFNKVGSTRILRGTQKLARDHTYRPMEKMYQVSSSDDRNLLLQQAAMAQRGLRPQASVGTWIKYYV